MGVDHFPLAQIDWVEDDHKGHHEFQYGDHPSFISFIGGEGSLPDPLHRSHCSLFLSSNFPEPPHFAHGFLTVPGLAIKIRII